MLIYLLASIRTLFNRNPNAVGTSLSCSLHCSFKRLMYVCRWKFIENSLSQVDCSVSARIETYYYQSLNAKKRFLFTHRRWYAYQQQQHKTLSEKCLCDAYFDNTICSEAPMNYLWCVKNRKIELSIFTVYTSCALCSNIIPIVSDKINAMNTMVMFFATSSKQSCQYQYAVSCIHIKCCEEWKTE